MSSPDSWPPSLKQWVAKCLGQMTEANKQEAQAELRKVIADAFEKHTLWTTDWNGVQLQSLMPKLPPTLGIKRKSIDNEKLNTKKAKKNSKTLANEYNYNDQVALNRRAQRFQREHEIERTRHNGGSSKQQFNQHYRHPGLSETPYGKGDEPEGDPNVIDWDRYTIVGTSTDLLKDYLRLTTEPKPETIRPLHILQRTLTELKKRWKEQVAYNWICSQLKSLRQDLTVQRIKNEFTVQVYEIHARIALECGDMVEYNQCQATLKLLYELGIPGKVEEFTAYRILMLLHGRNRSELNIYVGQLTTKQKVDPAVSHALSVQRALAMGNYHSLFELYVNAPNMGAYIMDHFIPRERARALLVITKAYMKISLEFIQNELAFDTLEETREFLKNHNGDGFVSTAVPDAQKVLDCRPVHPKLLQSYEEKYRKIIIKGAI